MTKPVHVLLMMKMSTHLHLESSAAVTYCIEVLDSKAQSGTNKFYVDALPTVSVDLLMPLITTITIRVFARTGAYTRTTNRLLH